MSNIKAYVAVCCHNLFQNDIFVEHGDCCTARNRIEFEMPANANLKKAAAWILVHTMYPKNEGVKWEEDSSWVIVLLPRDTRYHIKFICGIITETEICSNCKEAVACEFNPHLEEAECASLCTDCAIESWKEVLYEAKETVAEAESRIDVLKLSVKHGPLIYSE